MSKQQFHELTIASVSPQTDLAKSIQFDVPQELREDFTFLPGQYLTLRANVDGNDIRRSYSICSPLSQSNPEVGIKLVEGGAFSTFAQSLEPGDTLLVMPPQGRFTAEIGGQHRYLLLASGSGITPCLSIAQSVLEHEPESLIALVYGNSSTATIMFRREINALKDKYTDRFQLIHVLSRESTDVDFLNGRLDGKMIKALTERTVLDVNKFDKTYICGPQGMIEDVSSTLRQLGVAEEAIKFELFNTGLAPKTTKKRASKNAETGALVTITLDGSDRTISVDGSTDTVLAAAQSAGMDLPFSCAGGMCCTCRCKIVEGKAEMDVNYSLQDWEIEAGFTLACQTRPVSETLSLDFDAS